MSYEGEKSGIMVFQDTFEYLMNEELSEHDFCELMRHIYQVRWGNEKPNEAAMSKDVKLVWRTLKHSVRKSAQNARQYEKNKQKKQNDTIDTSTGEVFEPIDEPMTSELTVDHIFEEEQPYTNTTLSEFIKSRPEGMMQCPQWSSFVAMYPDAEKIQKISGITELYAVTLYSQLRKNAFAFGN